MYSSITLRSDDGRPGVAYLAHVADASGQHAEVRYAQAQVALPTAATDWKIYTVDSASIPADTGDVFPLPEGLGLFVDHARLPDGSPVVVAYDRGAGELRLSVYSPTGDAFGTSRVIAGSSGVDAGWTPSIAVDASSNIDVAYVSATANDLNYVTTTATATTAPTPVVVDNGYRIVGTTVDGLPKPTFDFVGANAQLVMGTGGALIAYQDATTQELLLAQQMSDGTWPYTSIAGAAMPWDGAYGFFASGASNGGSLVMSSWVIDQPDQLNWVEVFAKTIAIQ
jgi:hypothetical protein